MTAWLARSLFVASTSSRPPFQMSHVASSCSLPPTSPLRGFLSAVGGDLDRRSACTLASLHLGTGAGRPLHPRPAQLMYASATTLSVCVYSLVNASPRALTACLLVLPPSPFAAGGPRGTALPCNLRHARRQPTLATALLFVSRRLGSAVGCLISSPLISRTGERRTATS